MIIDIFYALENFINILIACMIRYKDWDISKKNKFCVIWHYYLLIQKDLLCLFLMYLVMISLNVHCLLFLYLISMSFKLSCKVKALLFSPIGTPSTFLNKIGQHYFPFFDNLSLVLHFTQPKLCTYKHIDTHRSKEFLFMQEVFCWH